MEKILVINNDLDTLSLLQMWLKKKGYTVKYTEDAELVPDLIKEFRPKLVIVDILQRKIAEQLENYKTRSAFKVLLMTGYTLKSHKNVLPVDDTIEKPFDLVMLESKVSSLIDSAV